jgi:hypothetical protein
MDFFTRWDHSGNSRVLCIDTPEELQLQLLTVLQNRAPLYFSDPFAMHIPLIDQIILLYDFFVLRLRDPIRELEKVSMSITLLGRNKLTSVNKSRLSTGPNFRYMHKIYKDVLHGWEVLSVTVETMNGIQRQQKMIYGSLYSDLAKTYTEQAQEYMSFQLQMVKSLSLRASSNHATLQSEIQLVIKPFTNFLLPTPAPGIKLTRAGIQR